MAKIGECDPRWIVAERDDGKNVNAWHWEEKDLSKACHGTLKDMFQGRSVDAAKLANSEVTAFAFTELDTVSGDVTVARRKGKIICYFEISCSAKWTATTKKGSRVEGKLSATDIEHDNFSDDFPVAVTVSSNGGAGRDQAVAVAQTAGRALFRSIIKEHFDKLFEYYRVGSKSGGVASPTSPTSPTAPTNSATLPKPLATTASTHATASNNRTQTGNNAAVASATTSDAFQFVAGASTTPMFSASSNQTGAKGNNGGGNMKTYIAYASIVCLAAAIAYLKS